MATEKIASTMPSLSTVMLAVILWQSQRMASYMTSNIKCNGSHGKAAMLPWQSQRMVFHNDFNDSPVTIAISENGFPQWLQYQLLYWSCL